MVVSNLLLLGRSATEHALLLKRPCKAAVAAESSRANARAQTPNQPDRPTQPSQSDPPDPARPARPDRS
jgi:hypothetical protein